VLFRKLSALLLASLGLSACASSSHNIPSYDEQAASHTRPVELFISKRPTRPYAEQGFVEARQVRSDSSPDDVLNRMRRAAAARGCDAVIFVDSGTTVSGWIGHGGGFVRTNQTVRGSCAVWTGPESAAPPSLAAAAQRCVPNATQLCYGPGACQGAQACLPDGTGFTACDCGSGAATSGAAPEPAQTGTSAAPAAAVSP
jgi:hypothetical protein